MTKILNCLCCGKPLHNDSQNWHKTCVNSFFGSDKLPKIEISDILNHIDNIAEAKLENGENLTGVQKKLSVGLSIMKDKLTVMSYPQGYIIKPETAEFPNIGRAEHLVMMMANHCGIKTASHGLIITDDNKYVYIVKRFDRKNGDKIHMEDFCQLSNLPSEYKYSSSYERIGKLIDKYCSVAPMDKIEFYYRTIFNYITCNSDMHLKNYSLMEDDGIQLSKAYDLLPVNIIYPNDTEEVALTLNGKKNNLTKNDFINFGINIGIDKKTCLNLIHKIISYENDFVNLIDQSLLDDDTKDKFKNELKKRINKLM